MQDQAMQQLRDDLGAQPINSTVGTADSAIAAQLQAQVQARYVMAMRRPRSWTHVRTLLLNECRRPGFAETAIYQKPVGKDKFVSGFSIRFAEAVVRSVTNIMPEMSTVYDDARKRIVRVQVTDLESNATYAQDITIEKTVERKFLRKGQASLGSRANSYGDIVHLVEATEGDLMNKEGSAVSKALRNLVLRLLPGDIQDDARETIAETISNADAKDPQAAIKKVADGFARLNILPADLSDYLGHDLSRASPAQISDLRKVYTAVQGGEVSWAEVCEARAAKREADEDEASDEPESRTNGTKKLAAKLKDKSAIKITGQEGVTEETSDAIPEDDFKARAERILKQKSVASEPAAE